MKILFCGDLTPGTNSWMRFDALKRLGHRVEGFQVTRHFFWGGKYASFPLRSLLTGPPLWYLNRDLKAAFGTVQPGLVWIEKGRFVTASTLRGFKEKGSLLAYYTGDPSFQYFTSRHFNRCAPYYDVVAHIKTWEVEEYRRRGFRGLYVAPAYDERLHHPAPWRSSGKKERWDVVFIGRWEKERERDLKAIQSLGVKLAVWGPRFREHCRDRELMEGAFQGPWIRGEDYARALGESKIALCFLAKIYPDQLTYRTFEVPACGGFMLAQRTAEQRRFFAEGREAAYFSNQREMLDKIRFYLDHGNLRKKIAAAGLRRCRSGRNTHQDRVAQILAFAQKRGGRKIPPKSPARPSPLFPPPGRRPE